MTTINTNADIRTSRVNSDRNAKQRYYFIISLFFLSGFSPAFFSLALISAVSALGFIFILTAPRKLSRVPRDALYYLVATVYTLGIVALSWGGQVNILSFFAESKIVALLSLAFIFCLFFKKFQAPLASSKITWALIVVNLGYLIASGAEFRYIDKVPSGGMISIYMSVILALAFMYESRIVTKGILLGFILLLGSSTGLAALVAGTAVKWINSKGKISLRRVAVYSLPLCILLFVVYYYTLTYRGRDLLDLESLDRYQLASAGVLYIIDTVTLGKFLFGYGVGTDLYGIFDYFPINASVLFWVQHSRAVDGFTGLVFHNEFLRVFVNFGIVGSIIIWGAVLNFFTTPSLRWAILAASLLNSTIYITPIFVFAFVSEIICRSQKMKK